MTAAAIEETALTVIDHPVDEIVEANPALVVSAFRNYQQIQAGVDSMMPDAIMTIQGKRFRKKTYWRAIATAFNLELELRDERREVQENGDWGYLVTYRATARNGRTCDGDGACFVSEKSGKMATVHCVRAHAHTRAKNRAIADLVGFGEVSSEEVSPEEFTYGGTGAAKQAPRKPAAASQRPGEAKATEKQISLLTAQAFSRADEMIEQAIRLDITLKHDERGALMGSIKKAAVGFLDLDMSGGLFAIHVDPLLAAIKNAGIGKDGGVVIEEVGEI